MSNTAMVSIRVRLAMQEADPDGSLCIGCGDAVYLKASELIMRTESGQLMGTVEGQICQACGDCIRETLKEGAGNGI